jgi:starvation-inducible DNA-binding protein
MPPQAVEKISTALNVLSADTFALYPKTKNFHWNVSGSPLPRPSSDAG